MPREGVPYPERVLCSLKNTIAMIEQKLGLKIEKINGVGPDPSGNVTIVSDDAALTIEEDAAQHQVTIGLDRTELPSAAVTSVNGETGAVVLDADDIAGRGADNSVMDNIINLESAALFMRSDLNDEITARGNADAALQTNINALAATVPESSITPDPLKVVMRDNSGIAYAADPISGATDKSLVSTNWISQTGSGKPNNVLHDTGNESFKGLKLGRASLANRIIGIPQPSQNGLWTLMYSFTFSAVTDTLTIHGTLQDSSNAMTIEICEFLAIIASNQAPYNGGVMKSRITNGNVAAQTIAFTFDGTHLDIWVLMSQYRPRQIIVENISRYGNLIEGDVTTPNISLADYNTYRTYTHTLEVTRS